MNKNQFCVIMAGGTATHFWPVSRESFPKQFLRITDSGNSCLREAYDRCKGTVPDENILVITLGKYKDTVMDQIPELAPENLLLEPYGRKTAPCVAYSTYELLRRDPSAVVAMMPCDHVIKEKELFRQTLAGALDYASKNEVLMTLGIIPSRPDPNYGYIQVVGGKKARTSDVPVKVKTFTEKPDEDLAKVLFSSGEFFWNSGIFVWKASLICSEMNRHIPQITNCFAGWENALGSTAESQFLERAYAESARLSIDYGVMEKTDKAWLYPVQFSWMDVDKWEALYDSFPKHDRNHNAVYGAKTLLKDSRNNMIITSKSKGKLVAMKGMDGYMVIDTPDVLLICPKDDKQYNDLAARIGMPGYEKYR